MPQRTVQTHSMDKLREAFDECDVDGNGYITMEEYYTWALLMADDQGSGIEQIFRRYDATGEGYLDAREFAMVPGRVRTRAM